MNWEVTIMSGNIRMATLEDVSAILAIYEPYILNTAITFEYETPSEEAFRKRMEAVLMQFPWLVYEEEGKIAGYAYCARFKERAAFDWDCECSVYIDEKAHRRGIATALYTKLFELVEKQGYYNIYALITYSHESSVYLHKKFGFTEVGVYKKTGYKMEKWWDLLVMEKRIHSFADNPINPKTIHEITDLV
jgi:phosphinothricin acetyltransferase